MYVLIFHHTEVNTKHKTDEIKLAHFSIKEYLLSKYVKEHHDEKITVLITPPPIPTGLRESSRIPTGFLLDSNKFSKKAFSHIFSFPPTGLLLDSYWTPTGFLLDSYWTPTELKQMSQTESNGSDTGFLLDSYWSITITDMIYLTTLINLHSPSIFKKSVMFEYS